MCVLRDTQLPKGLLFSCEAAAGLLPKSAPPLLLLPLPPSASSFLADAWAKSDFGLTLDTRKNTC